MLGFLVFRPKNLVFRATVLNTLGKVGSAFLRIETSIIKTPRKKNNGIS